VAAAPAADSARRLAGVTLEGVAKEFDGTYALRSVTLALAAGDRVALLGPNGAGKSTLLGVLAGLVRPSNGTLRYAAPGATELGADDARARVGLLSHETFLYGDLTAYENLVFWARLYGFADPAGRARLWIDRVGVAARAAERPVRTFSRGMRQRVGLARALSAEPDLLLLDEPFTGLDRDGAELLAALLRERAGPGRAMVLCSHDLERAAPLCQRVVVLRDGRVAVDRALAETGAAAAAGDAGVAAAVAALRAAYAGEAAG
jgi:heme exporter protein A